ncbi:hypothetical protein SmJEL517_g01306 [Synchytrium microbalum]|uniref:Uncharacterized protein n=1 Tax=Synchytrium microbalum TaxID=1806994 RepID=A0A507CGA4_9FUNG|nr:uncharacterized protein SmJEL517_g01306 [Synchytrium microbalum]TPX36635.1 hypothetical protein SmJEL517_g01306 [Synchytrium microbalum]
MKETLKMCFFYNGVAGLIYLCIFCLEPFKSAQSLDSTTDPPPTFTSVLRRFTSREMSLVAMAIILISSIRRKNLHHPSHLSPYDFVDDADGSSDGSSASDFNSSSNRISDRSSSSSSSSPRNLPPTLEELCVSPVSRLYRAAARRLHSRGQTRQHWWGLMTLIIPLEDSKFTTQQGQREFLERCIDQGAYIKVIVALDSEADFAIMDVNNVDGAPLLRDSRQKIVLEFRSPRFSAYDEVLELDEKGKWRLRWQWRVSDIDYLFASQQRKRKYI